MCVCVQEPDLRYLVENIWASQSALSACSDLEELVLVRWDTHKPWSPWNCVLLTKDEGQAHSKLENALEVWMDKLRVYHQRFNFSLLFFCCRRTDSTLLPRSCIDTSWLRLTSRECRRCKLPWGQRSRSSPSPGLMKGKSPHQSKPHSWFNPWTYM